MSKMIWVIEDDEAILDAIEIILEQEGLSAKGSRDGEILDQVVEIFPNLILVDHYLKTSTGSTLCQKIKANPEMKDIPVLLISGHAKIESIAKDCGADGFIEKPFDIVDFVAEVNKHLFKQENLKKIV